MRLPNRRYANKPGFPKLTAGPLLMGSLLVLLSACSSSDGGGGSGVTGVNNDRYALAGEAQVSVTASQGLLANDGNDYESVELVTGVNTNSSLTLNADGSFQYRPAAGISQDGFIYNGITSDGSKKQGQVRFVIAQGIAGCHALDVESAQSATFSVLPDNISTEDGVTLSVLGSPSKGTVSSFNQQTGQLTYLHSGNGRGYDEITLRATDSFGGTADLTYRVALTPVRIMPLGDSLTQGIESDSDPSSNPDLDSPSMSSRVGYRKFLFDDLNASSFSFDFVGTETDAGFNVLSDFEHQGHPGYTDYEISGLADPDGSNSDEFNAATDGVYKWLNQNPADVILLHAGTNTIIRRQTAVGMERILDEIERWQADNNQALTTLVAKIIDKQRNPTDSQNVTTYNNNVQSLVNTRIAQGENLVLVDMFSAVSTSNLDSDGTHLTAAGYREMADEWYDSINSNDVVAKCQ